MTGPRPVVVHLIEDDPELRFLAAEALAAQGWRVIDSRDGVEGVENLQRETPDVVVLDLLLPGLSGWQVWDWLQASGRHPVPVVVWTAAAFSHEAPPHVRVVSKNEPFEVLLQAVRTVLARRMRAV